MRSPEQPYKVGQLLVLAAVNGAWAVGNPGPEGRLLGLGAGLLCLLLAWRVSRVRLVLTDVGLTEVGLFRRTSHPWAGIVGVRPGRPGGLLDGRCPVLVLRDGREVPLGAVRVYSWFPVPAHLGRLDELVAELERRATREVGARV